MIFSLFFSPSSFPPDDSKPLDRASESAGDIIAPLLSFFLSLRFSKKILIKRKGARKASLTLLSLISLSFPISGYVKRERDSRAESNLIVYRTKTMCDSETKRRDLPKISLSFFLSLICIYISVCVFKRALSLSL